MREILFRGKVNNPDNISWLQQSVGEWVEGNLEHDPDLESYKINGFNYYSSEQGLEREPFVYRVDPETIGQYTGMKDKNGEKIFEGDIVKTKAFGGDSNCGVNFNGYDVFKVIYSDATYKVVNHKRRFNLALGEKYEVIGNIYDNPELLEGEENE